MEDQPTSQNVEGNENPVKEPQTNYNPPQGQYNPPPNYSPPPGQYQPPYQPPPGQQVRGGPSKGKNPLKMLMDPENLTKVIALGLFLMFIGAAFFTMIMASRPPDRWDEKYDSNHDGSLDTGEYDDYLKDYRGFKFMRSLGIIIGGILLEFGILILLIALLGGAIINQNLDSYSRLGMIVTAGIIVALELFFLAQLMTLQFLDMTP
jgi:hypothetical protein